MCRPLWKYLSVYYFIRTLHKYSLKEIQYKDVLRIFFRTEKLLKQ